MNYAQIFDAHANGHPSKQFKGCTFSGVTGTMAAGLAANGAVAALKYPASAPATKKWALAWMHIHWFCIGSFSQPATPGRALALRRGTGDDPTGGVALAISKSDTSCPAAETLPAGRIATTGAITIPNLVLEPGVKGSLLVGHAGASGNDYDEMWTFNDPLVLNPGQLVALIAESTFDAGGTWQASIRGAGVELP